MKKIQFAICLAAFLVPLSSCEEKNAAAVKLLDDIHALYDQGQYDSVLVVIDSLRRTYPEAVEQRKEALSIFQQASLAIAQQNLAKVDSALQAVEGEVEYLKKEVEAHRSQGIATAEELSRLTKMKVYRDSLQGIFNMECAKIKYIHKRQEENKAAQE